ncbi:MAG TPA: acyl-CoA dehydrogenase family protein [Solirubrobacteraceae bacterium]|jgi:alkylation response protein AidB-like acyl-CoA dehydrogenase|nr:acyl-CoA dehydrogenase family protein [Solirubrobacteraceae bacterium]
MPDLASPGPAAATNDLDRAADELSALARELAPATEEHRRLPDELVAGLRASGLLRAGAPATVEAAQAPPSQTLRCAEKVARGDASAGWCVSINATSSLLGGWLPEEGLAEVFGDAASAAAGVWAPRGKAQRVDGGYRVSGRWPFCSAITHSQYFFGGCMVPDASGGSPRVRVLGFPVDELSILDTWHTSGLRGTGSHDAVAEDVFVPEHRSLQLLEPPTSGAALYRFPIFAFFALSIAAAALGNARGAIEDASTLARSKVGMGSSRTLAERSATWSAVAQSEASLRAARAFYYQAIDDAWAEAQKPGPVSEELRCGLRLAATHAVRTAADVARSMCDLGGGTAIYADSPLQRRFRDAHAATAHFQVNPATWELTGRLLLGQPTDTAML